MRWRSASAEGHHVAQNSTMTAFLPIHRDKGTESPFRFLERYGGRGLTDRNADHILRRGDRGTEEKSHAQRTAHHARFHQTCPAFTK